MDCILTCPICAESPLVPPVYQCHEGHVICNQCEVRVANCPTCRKPLPKENKIRNRVVEQAQPAPIACKLAGCSKNFSNEQDRLLHEKRCDYRLIRYCRLSGIDKNCTRKFGSADVYGIMDHFKSAHPGNTKAIDTKYESYRLSESTRSCFFYVREPKLSLVVLLEVEKYRTKRTIKSIALGGCAAVSDLRVKFTVKTDQEVSVRTGELFCKRWKTLKGTHTTPAKSVCDRTVGRFNVEEFNAKGDVYLEGVSVSCLAAKKPHREARGWQPISTIPSSPSSSSSTSSSPSLLDISVESD